ncbi:TPA: hypothetical protein HA297_02580, partial [Candidatus Woesearchaeota archaeon]|nr:hypothetical protein [Candidatus Woesearchaeota archaeon]
AAPTGIPEEILQSPEYQALTDEQKELAQFAYNIQKEEDVLRKIRAEAALAEAIKLADPVFKSQLRILQDELQRGISSQIASNTESRQQLVQQIDFLRTQGNLQEAESLAITLDQAQRENSSREAQVGAEIARIQRGIANIQEDLTFNRGQIGIEEQAQLARQVRQYEQQLTQTQEAAVDAGLGFSSIRAEAEKRLGEELGDISESTRRQAMRDIRNLEVTSSRKQQEAEFSQTDLERRSAEQQLELARRTEQVVGSEKLPSGLLPTGQNTLGIRGSITEGVQAREQQLQNLQLEQQSQERVGQEKLTDIVRAGEQTLGTANLPTEATTSIAPLGSITGTFETDRLNEISRLQGILEERQGETISLSNNND